MKKIFMGCLAFICATSAWADYAFSIEDFTIAAGEEKEIEVKMYNDVAITAFQFNIALPEGVSIMYDEDEEEYSVVRTSRLLSSHVITTQIQQNGDWKVMVYHNNNKNIKGNSGDVVLTITLVASDQVSTGTFTPTLSKQEMTEANGTKHKIDDASYNCSVTLNTTVTTLGYASFSWPKALDFTNSGLTAFIVTSCSDTSMHLEPVTKVPANTGLILKGTAGSENIYPLETTDDEALDDVSENMLTSNTTGAYTVETDNVYVLSNLDDGKPGFYLASQGIHVGQYKSFLVLSENPARKGLTFDEETVVTGVKESLMKLTDNTDVYDLQGRRVLRPTKGMYVENHKIRIIK